MDLPWAGALALPRNLHFPIKICLPRELLGHQLDCAGKNRRHSITRQATRVLKLAKSIRDTGFPAALIDAADLNDGLTSLCWARRGCAGATSGSAKQKRTSRESLGPSWIQATKQLQWELAVCYLLHGA